MCGSLLYKYDDDNNNNNNNNNNGGGGGGGGWWIMLTAIESTKRSHFIHISSLEAVQFVIGQLDHTGKEGC